MAIACGHFISGFLAQFYVNKSFLTIASQESYSLFFIYLSLLPLAAGIFFFCFRTRDWGAKTNG